MLKLISKILGGTKSEKDIKEVKPIVEEINRIYESLHSISDEELKSKTEKFRSIISERTKNLEEEKASLKDKLQNIALSPEETMSSRDRLKDIEKDLFDTIQDTLDELLPEAYAAVKEVCKRLTDRNFEYVYADQANSRCCSARCSAPPQCSASIRSCTQPGSWRCAPRCSAWRSDRCSR